MSMAGALVFGLVNHFFIQGADHVAHVAREWRTLFASTAALLAVLEAAGTGDRRPRCGPRAEGIMRVFLAGGSGAIGVPLVRHSLRPATRSPR